MDAAGVFEAQRPRLLALAYRMLGGVSDAEDVVQDAWLRWERAEAARRWTRRRRICGRW
jgi:DNA-directed RNA polymerase specialized sigma24 family protein